MHAADGAHVVWHLAGVERRAHRVRLSAGHHEDVRDEVAVVLADVEVPGEGGAKQAEVLVGVAVLGGFECELQGLLGDADHLGTPTE